jgi:hypothetical protein
MNPVLAAKHALPLELVAAIRELEAAVKLPIWLLVQDAKEDGLPKDSPNMLGDIIARAFFEARHNDLVKGQRIALEAVSKPG